MIMFDIVKTKSWGELQIYPVSGDTYNYGVVKSYVLLLGESSDSVSSVDGSSGCLRTIKSRFFLSLWSSFPAQAHQLKV